MVSREMDFVLGYSRLPCTRRVCGKQISTKQDIVGKNKFAVHVTEPTDPCYHNAKLNRKSCMKM